MEEKKPEEVVVPADESALDKELQESIDTIKAGQVEPAAPAPKPEAPAAPKAEEPSNPPAPVGEQPKYEFNLPKPGKGTKFESDEVYEKRVELMDLIAKKKLAPTAEQKEQLTTKIKETRKELSLLDSREGIINPLQKSEVPAPVSEEDEALKADRERLRELGGATKEDIEAIVQKDRLATEVRGTLEKFVERHPELSDADAREVFFDFVDSNYNWQNKTGKALMTVLELARESMFRPSETIQDRVLKGANVQEKINAMQFPGGTVAKTEYSPEMRKSIDELKATGMTEEKAVELLAD